MRDLIEACTPLIYDSVTELGITEEDISNLIGPSTVGTMADVAILSFIIQNTKEIPSLRFQSRSLLRSLLTYRTGPYIFHEWVC